MQGIPHTQHPAKQTGTKPGRGYDLLCFVGLRDQTVPQQAPTVDGWSNYGAALSEECSETEES